MSVNKALTKRDTVLGGKIRCDGCGGEWWLSGPQADAFRESGEWPHVCGNNAAIDVPGSRTDCADETEMVFLPYDVEENAAAFEADGQPEVAAKVREQAAKMLAEVSD